MPEPTSSGVAGAAAAYKAFGGTAAAAASGATRAAVVVMLMTPPRDKREWTVGLISTVVSSIEVVQPRSSISSFTTGRSQLWGYAPWAV